MIVLALLVPGRIASEVLVVQQEGRSRACRVEADSGLRRVREGQKQVMRIHGETEMSVFRRSRVCRAEVDSGLRIHKAQSSDKSKGVECER